MSQFEADILDSDRRLLAGMEHANELFMRALRGHPVAKARVRRIYQDAVVFDHDPNAKRRLVERAAVERAERHHAKIASLRASQRDPCACCGVRGEQHDTMGCKQYRIAA